jgi:glyoxylase-like metal-dependent hydrolase (beta-lactamase superfamily II)
VDHIGGAAQLKQATGAPVLMHPEDLWLLKNVETQANLIGLPAPPAAELDQPLREGDEVRWGENLRAEVLHTRSLCLHLPERKILLAGDTLFAGSIGRTDLWGGSYDSILVSIGSKLLALDDETIVFPGHGPDTTIAAERDRFLQGLG